MAATIYDIVGIGIGPFNLSLACLSRPIDSLNCLFLDRAAEFNWHGGMLLEDATLQTPFLCDLVTLADPTSPFSLLNYMKRSGQIYSFYSFLFDAENFFLPRNTFNAYLRWVADQLDSLMFNRNVISVEYDSTKKHYRVNALDIQTGNPVTYCARRLALGTGTTAAIPTSCTSVADKAVHSSVYLQNRNDVKNHKSITVVGSGQSAAEIVYDLLSDIDRFNYTLHWITRSPRLVPRELTKQTLQFGTPDYLEYFSSLPEENRARLAPALKGLFQGINPSLINRIFDLRYRKLLTGRHSIELITNSQISSCHYDNTAKVFHLQFEQWEAGAGFEHSSEVLILATGYQWPNREFLEPVRSRINWAEHNRFIVARNYSIDKAGGEIFTSNAEIHADSFIPPDLGQACYRNSVIIREVLGREVYPVEKSIAFQHFEANPLRKKFEDKKQWIRN